ncbi:MAG: putative UDP-arabinopyranose mutase 4 [Microgenomates group bacterium GW2011_GWC1_37_8]|nr:MAG: putative UDP-arabinopyranose mutase 4 [Microgenomates group bacterium GW2011_GWC1_37_8]
MKIAIVIPTAREANIKTFLESWDFPDYCSIYVIEDNSVKQFDLPQVHFHGSWQEANSWIFSKKCGGGMRSFGFYKAWLDGNDYIISLDDDCLPYIDGESFVKEHIKQLEIDNGKWLWTTEEIRARGIPYMNTGKGRETMINMGFWKLNADFDAPTQLVYGAREVPPKILSPIPQGYYAPLCGMNLSFKRDAVGMMFQPLMGEEYGIWRLDDIWCGIIAKKICDHLEYNIRAGNPSIIHSRASNVWTNLKRESLGFEANETFWQMIDEIHLSGKTINECYLEIADILNSTNEKYFRTLGNAMKIWIELF